MTKWAASLCVRIEEELGLCMHSREGQEKGDVYKAAETAEALQQSLRFSRLLASFQISCALSIWMPSLPSSDVTAWGDGFWDEDGLWIILVLGALSQLPWQ